MSAITMLCCIGIITGNGLLKGCAGIIIEKVFIDIGKGIQKLGRLNEQLQRLSGGVLIVLGLWLLWTNI